MSESPAGPPFRPRPERPPGRPPASGTEALVALPELDARGRGAFVHEGHAYAVFTLEGGAGDRGREVVVTDGVCPHKGGPLAEGVLRDGAVVCPWHWYTFDLATGACRTADEVSLRRHPVVEVAGRLHARVSAPVRRSWAEVLRAHARGAD
ncbi:MAG: Rieske (2Fe-2S) protein [Kineosporiaceae bacterium]